MVTETLGAAIMRWAAAEPRIDALVLIGSQVRAEQGAAFAADRFSDWDFQVITPDPTLFRTKQWLEEAGVPAPLAYVARMGRLGSAAKVSAVFASGGLDLVIIPTAQLQELRARFAGGQGPVDGPVRDLAAVLVGGHRFVKGAAGWGDFYAAVATGVPPPRLDDVAVCDLADGFVCDYVSTRQKIARGEKAAAQRWLHHSLAETNFRLLHELRLRQGRPSLPDARRLEQVADQETVTSVQIACGPTTESLRAATDASAETLRGLMQKLVGDRWQWPHGLPLA